MSGVSPGKLLRLKCMSQIISSGAAARILGISTDRVAELVAEGMLTSQFIGGRHLFKLSDIEKLADRRAKMARGDGRIKSPPMSER